MDEPSPSLTEGQREQIKLRAAYMNGIAIGLILVGGLSLPTTIALNARSRSELLLAFALFLFSFLASPYIHIRAMKSLRRLDT